MGTLVVKPDNTYEVFLDKKSKSTGSLHEDWKFPRRLSMTQAIPSRPTGWTMR